MKKTILIICANNLEKAPRFLMEVDALVNDYDIIAGGLGNFEEFNFSCIDISAKKGLKKIPSFHFNWPVILRKPISLAIKLIYRSQFNDINLDRFKVLKDTACDLIIVHHLTELPLGFKLAARNNCKVIFNAHEYYTREFEDNELWLQNVQQYYKEIATTYLKKCHAIWVVGAEIAKEYAKEYGVETEVVVNSKKLYELSPIQVGDKIKLVHHGAAIPSRGIESMIEMMDFLGENYTLDLILMPSDIECYNRLLSLIDERSNVHLREPVATLDIPKELNKYDIGCYILKPTNFNNLYALPNKFFEFIQARLVIAIAPSPEMKNIVESYNLGVVSQEFSAQSLAEEIKKVSKVDIMNYKNNCNKHAKTLSVEGNYIKIRKSVNSVLS